MTTFFTADTHFGDERVMHLSQRPFKYTFEMDEVMIDNWNAVVRPEDTVYHLGDFGDYEIHERLSGKIRLILGNYEREDLEKGRVTTEQLMEWFESIHMGEQGIYTYSQKTNEYWTLVHEPSHRNFQYGKFNLFGHIHGTQMVKHNGLNVGVDCHHFRPISMERVLFYKTAIEHHYDQEVFSL